MAIQYFPVDIDHCLATEGLATAILSRTVHYSMLYEDVPKQVLSCVSLASRILGIKKRVWTPKGLYNELLKSGAYVIK